MPALLLLPPPDAFLCGRVFCFSPLASAESRSNRPASFIILTASSIFPAMSDVGVRGALLCSATLSLYVVF